MTLTPTNYQMKSPMVNPATKFSILSTWPWGLVRRVILTLTMAALVSAFDLFAQYNGKSLSCKKEPKKTAVEKLDTK